MSNLDEIKNRVIATVEGQKFKLALTFRALDYIKENTQIKDFKGLNAALKGDTMTDEETLLVLHACLKKHHPEVTFDNLKDFDSIASLKIAAVYAIILYSEPPEIFALLPENIEEKKTTS